MTGTSHKDTTTTSGRTYTYEVSAMTPGEHFVMSTAQGPFPMETTYTLSLIHI